VRKLIVAALQNQITNAELGQLRAWLAAGGTVLFGNDLGAVDYDPTKEYVLMPQAVVTFRQVLASLTTAPAAHFGQSNHLGQVPPASKPTSSS
jgi:hypothetical protein